MVFSCICKYALPAFPFAENNALWAPRLHVIFQSATPHLVSAAVGSEREHNVVKGTNALQEDMDTMEGADERGCGDADAENSE